MGVLKLSTEATPSTPPASNALLYASTASPSRATFLDDTGTANPLVAQASTDTGSARLQNKDLDAASFKIVDGSDTTKKIGWQASGASTATILTIIEAQTTSQSLNIPNLTASSIVIVDTLAQSITGVKTMTNMSPLANTATVPSMTFGSGAGTFVTSPLAGQWEFSGSAFYSTPVASARGLSPSTMFSIVPAGDFTLLTTSGVQSAFPTTGDVWTLAASTAYFFEGHYQITKTTTTVTIAMAFAAAASLSVTSIEYFVWAFNAAVNTTTATVAMTNVNQIASTVINATATTATSIYFKGIIRINAGGTLTPQINFSANTTVPVMKVDSFITFTPLGSSTTNIMGNVG